MKISHQRKFLSLIASSLLMSFALDNNANATTSADNYSASNYPVSNYPASYYNENQYLAANPYSAPNLYAMAYPNGGWCFLIAPYGWLPSVSGSAEVRNRSTDFSVPFSKILSHLSFGAEIHLEASNGPWTFMLDPSYFKLTEDQNNRFFNPEVVSKITLIDGGVFYRVVQECLPNNQLLSFEVLGGARYLGIDNSIDFGPRFSVSGHTDLATPIVGGRIKYDVSSTSHLWLRADGGGFGIGSVNSTWSATAGYSYSITPAVDLGIAYRALDINFSKNSSASMNVLLYGPMLGVGFKF